MKLLKTIWWLLTGARSDIEQIQAVQTQLMGFTPEPTIRIESIELAEMAVNERLSKYYGDKFDTQLLQDLSERLENRIRKQVAREITNLAEQKVNTLLQQKLGLTHN